MRFSSQDTPARPASRRTSLGLAAASVCVALLGGALQPAAAADGSDVQADSPVLGGFAAGDGLEAGIDERDGSVSLTAPVPGIGLAWHSGGASVDHYGLGLGWTLGLPQVGVEGGVRVFPSSGGQFEADPTHSTGLAGYPTSDVRFEQVPGGVVPARPDGSAPEVRFAYRMFELGGTVTHFNPNGDPVMQKTATGQRSDWIWHASTPHRLVGVVNELGVVTELDWDTEPGLVSVRVGANLPGTAPVWRVELDGGRVARVVDAASRSTTVGYRDGLVEQVSGVSGAVTSVAWQTHRDEVPRAATIRTTDADGAELSARSWRHLGANLPTGWPAASAPGEAAGADLTYGTELSDGHTVVRSEYGARHTLTSRALVVSTTSGAYTAQTQTYTYPGDDDEPEPGGFPLNWARPLTAEVTHTDARGSSRTQTERLAYDELGRLTSRTSADGTVIEVAYAAADPESPHPPIGLPVRERTTAPDGLVVEAVHTLTDDGSAVIATEEFSGRVDAPLVKTGLMQATVEADGFVSEERLYPNGDDATVAASITRYTRAIDLAAGTLTTTETSAADTPVEATTSQVTSLRHGAVLEQFDPLGNAATASYDDLGRAVEATTGGLTSTTDYEDWQAHGRNAMTVTGPDGLAVTEVRDPIGRVIRLLDNIDHGTAKPGYERLAEWRDYPEPGLVTVTDAWGAASSTRQDVLGRTIAATAPGGMVQLTRYDDVANTATTGLSSTGALSDAEFITTAHLDAAGRTTNVRGHRADGVTVPETETAYDGFGRAVSSADGVKTSSVTYDAYGNPATTVVGPVTGGVPGGSLGAPITATRTFDGHGVSLEKMLSADGVSSSGGARVLDARGRTEVEHDRLDRATTYEYTIDGLLERSADPTDRQTRLEYHPATREPTSVTITAPDGEEVVTAFEHDPLTGATTAVWDPRDRDGTRIEYEYDDFRNLLRTTYPDGRQLSHGYDAHGRLTSSTDIDGAVTRYTYTADGLLAEVAQTHPDGTTTGVAYTYDNEGRIVRLDRGNGAHTSYTFTSAGQVESEATTKPDGASAERRYTYLPTGNLHTRTDTRTAETRTTRTTTEYAYDAFDRLIRSEVLDASDDHLAPVTTTEYEPTLDGDLARETVTTHGDQPLTVTRDFRHSPMGELERIDTTTMRPGEQPEAHRADQEYDTAGNLIRDRDGVRYAYDPTGRLTTQTAPDGTITTTTYWADGTRRDRTSTDPRTGHATRTAYYWNGSTLINEAHTDADATTRTAGYLLGATRHARTTPNGTTYYDSDRHGNITETIGAQGDLSTGYSYSDYGTASLTGDESTTGIERNPFQFVGEYTQEDGTQPLGTRIYHPAIMQFTTPDTEPLHNLRAYADLNPIMNVDPTGTTASPDEILNWVMLGVSAIAAVVGAIALAGFTPIGAPAIIGFAFAAGVVAGDVVNVGATIAQLIQIHQPDLFTPEQSAALHSDELTYAGYAFAAAAAPGALAAILMRGRALITESIKHARSATYLVELKNVTSDAFEQAALRASSTKRGALKRYYHGTSRNNEASLEQTGFDHKRATSARYGPGTYMARDITTAVSYGSSVFVVNPNITRAMKVDAWYTRGLKWRYELRNPLWTKTSPRSVPKYVKSFADEMAVEAYATEHRVQAVYIGTVFAPWSLRELFIPSKPSVLRYLRIRGEEVYTVAPSTAMRGLAPKEKAAMLENAANSLKRMH